MTTILVYNCELKKREKFLSDFLKFLYPKLPINSPPPRENKEKNISKIYFFPNIFFSKFFSAKIFKVVKNRVLGKKVEKKQQFLEKKFGKKMFWNFSQKHIFGRSQIIPPPSPRENKGFVFHYRGELFGNFGYSKNFVCFPYFSNLEIFFNFCEFLQFFFI